VRQPRDWFPHRAVINLDRRPERLHAVNRRFEAACFAPVPRFAAIDALETPPPAGWQGTPGAYGCLASHLDIVRRASRDGLPHILIFEDDVVFPDALAARLDEVMAHLPHDWEMVSFGGIHREAPTPIGHGLVRLRETLSTHAYVIRNTLFSSFIEACEGSWHPVDVVCAGLQRARRCYGMLPHLAWQDEGFSDVQEDAESQWTIRESLVLVGDEIDAMIRDTAVVIASSGAEPDARAFYERFFPEMTKVVVSPERARDRDEVLRAGLAGVDRARFVLFTDGNLVPTRERFIRAGLKMCNRFDGSALFGHLLRLDDRDSALVRREGLKKVDLERYPPEPSAIEEGACLLTREALDRIGGWHPDRFAELSFSVPPNRALVLGP